MRKLITNGIIYDGTGNAPYSANILIENDRIASIGAITPDAVDDVLDAKGRAVTPGFIDAHRHSDITAMMDSDFGDLELAQGISTTLSGNCGLAPFPSVDESRCQLYDFIEPCLGKANECLKLNGFPDYIAALEKAGPYINIGGMIGTGAVKVAVKGFEKTPFTASEMQRAQNYIIEAMESGAFGISSGIMYTPECYSTCEEFVELLSPAAKYNGLLTCHIRGEGDSLVPSVEEIIDIAKKAGLRLNISHFKSVGCKNWHDKIFQAIEKVENARALGQDVTVDFYRYLGGSTTLMSLIPPSFLKTETERTLSKISTKAGMEQLRVDINRKHGNWDNMVLDIGWERIIINSVAKQGNKQYQGKSINAICKGAGYEDEVAFISDLLVDEQGKVGIIVMSMAQEDVDTVAKLPYSMVISDSLYGAPDCPHPRLYGSFSKVIREYVNQRGVLSIENAIHKMTGMIAERYHIPDRGEIRIGNFADLNIFDPKSIVDHASYSDSKQLSTGMDEVLIGGKIVWENNRRTGCYNANVLKLKLGI